MTYNQLLEELNQAKERLYYEAKGCSPLNADQSREFADDVLALLRVEELITGFIRCDEEVSRLTVKNCYARLSKTS